MQEWDLRIFDKYLNASWWGVCFLVLTECFENIVFLSVVIGTI